MLKQSVHVMSFYHAHSCPTLDVCVALLSWQLHLNTAIANIVARICVKSSQTESMYCFCLKITRLAFIEHAEYVDLQRFKIFLRISTFNILHCMLFSYWVADGVVMKNVLMLTNIH